jgi:regulator of replication initiation timing
MSILDNAKQVAKAVEEIHNLELYQRVLGLHSDIIELVEENNKLRQENEELKTKQKIRGKLRTVNNPDQVYYLYNEQGQQEDGPFCTICWDVDQKLVRPFAYNGESGRGHICEYCRSHRSPRHR